MKKIIFAIFLAFCTLQAEILSVGTAPNYAPYEFLNNGKLDGFDIEIMREIARRSGMKIEFKSYEFDKLIPALKSGKINVIGAMIKRTKEREFSLNFTKGVMKSSNYFLISKDSVLHKSHKAIRKSGETPYEDRYKQKSTNETLFDCDDLNLGAQRIGAENGSEQYEMAKFLGISAVAYPNNSIASMALLAGKIDILALDKMAAIELMKKYDSVVPLCESIDFTPQGFAVNKEDTELLELINSTLDKMQSDGTIAKLMQKYGL